MPAENPIIHIQIDGTPSMQGFVTVSNSRYIRTLQLVDSAATTAFSQSTPRKYYRFGTKRMLLPNTTSTLSARAQDFYDRSNPSLQNARIDVAVQPVDRNRSSDLSIIVTDLYQKDQEQATLVDTLSSNYLDKGYAVGMLAVRSEFEGTVYDVALLNQTIEYKTTPNNPNTFHPFYVIVLGTYEDVARYFQQLQDASQSEGLNLEDDKFVIFSKKLVADYSFLKIPEGNFKTTGIQRQVTINDGQAMVIIKDREKIERLMIDDRAKPNENISYQANYQPLRYTLPPAEFKFNIKAEKFNPIDNKAFLPIQNQDNLKITLDEIQENSISFNTNFRFGNAGQERGIYQFTVDVLPTALKQPEWWQKWNFREGENMDGAKTYNLFYFLDSLRKKTETGAIIGRFCYIVYKK